MNKYIMKQWNSIPEQILLYTISLSKDLIAWISRNFVNDSNIKIRLAAL